MTQKDLALFDLENYKGVVNKKYCRKLIDIATAKKEIEKVAKDGEDLYLLHLIYIMFDLQRDMLAKMSILRRNETAEIIELEKTLAQYNKYLAVIDGLKVEDLLVYEDDKEDIFTIIQCSLIATKKGKLTQFMNLVSNFMQKMTKVSI